MTEQKTPNDIAVLEVVWALDEGWKLAVHNGGVTDWSKESNERRNEIEIMQMKITKMILVSLHKRIK